MVRQPRPPPYSIIAFDCDSTLATIEGIEELAGPHREEIRRITDAAMSGETTVEAVYGARLAVVRPTKTQVEVLGRRYEESLLPNVRALVGALHWLGKRVCIVTGGLEPAVLIFARSLGVPSEDVFAVKVFHDADGGYAGFDERSPLTRSRGKLEIASALARQTSGSAGLAFVGDGVTDLEAQEATARFIAFGGVVRREVVFAGADERCAERDFAALLPLLCSPGEIERLEASEAHRELVRLSREQKRAAGG